jgi:hypothetical protein
MDLPGKTEWLVSLNYRPFINRLDKRLVGLLGLPDWNIIRGAIQFHHSPGLSVCLNVTRQRDLDTIFVSKADWHRPLFKRNFNHTYPLFQIVRSGFYEDSLTRHTHGPFCA